MSQVVTICYIIMGADAKLRSLRVYKKLLSCGSAVEGFGAPWQVGRTGIVFAWGHVQGQTQLGTNVETHGQGLPGYSPHPGVRLNYSCIAIVLT